MPDMAQIFTEESWMSNRRILLNVQLLGPNWGNVLAIKGPCFGYFENIFASKCLIWLKFSLKSHASQIEEYQSMSNYWDHIRAIFGPYQGHVLVISPISLLVGT